MSTIEKAAAKLAAKKSEAKAEERKSGNRSSLGSDQVTSSVPEKPAVHLPASPAVRPPVTATVRSQQDFNRLLPEAPKQHADLDFEALAAGGFLTPNSVRSGLGQEFRKIKRRVLSRVDQLKSGAEMPGSEPERQTELRPAPFNTFMVTSGLAAEGKTFVSLNLAVSLAAEVDREVLLVDGDIAKADLSRFLGLEGRVGLGDVLREPERLEEAMFTTNIPRLSVIPAGKYPDNLDELLASDLMEQLVHSLSEQNPERLVLFDAPPLLVTTEAAVLSRHLRQVLLVVEANRTPRDAVTQAVSELGEHRNVMLMLNKATGSGRFGYGYSYGYEQGDHLSNTQEVPATPQREAG